MKKKNLKKMSLNKENISQLSLSGLKGGTSYPDSMQWRACHSIEGISVCYCRSHEYNCTSEGVRCDCGTTGNCGDLV